MMFSKKFNKKVFKELFNFIDVSNFVSGVWFWLTDSKYRKMQRLDFMLESEVLNPSNRVCLECSKIKTYADWDVQIVMILRHVFRNFKYDSDLDNWNREEYWATADETIKKGSGDCDGLNRLIYVLARLKGIPSVLLWNRIGSVREGGHYSLLYVNVLGDVYPIDATYNVNLSKVKDRLPLVFGSDFFINNWYIWNEKCVFRGVN